MVRWSRAPSASVVDMVAPEDVGISTAGLQKLDEHLRSQYVVPGRISGALTLVARRGKVAWLSPLGLMDRERGKAVAADTIFRIYSMTKPVTSVAVMTLFERGLFQLADPVHRWIPAWENLRVYRYGQHPSFKTDPALRPMTMRDLLTHMSGLSYVIAERTHVDAAYRKLGIGDGKSTLAQMIDRISTLPLEYSPGAHWSYSVATDVLGYLVEVMSGEPLDSYLKRIVFDPLRMVDTSFVVPGHNLERLAANYSFAAEGPPTLADDPAKSPFARPRTFLSGGAGLVSTAADYFRFAEMLRRGGELDGARILGKKTVAYMTRNHLPDGGDLAAHALGSFSETRYEGVGFGLGVHVVIDPVRAQVPCSAGEFGWGGLASTAFWVDPAEELSVVFMTQLMPSTSYNLRGQIKSIVYGALID